MFVNCFTVKMASQFYKTTLKKLPMILVKISPNLPHMREGQWGLLSIYFV